jgi:hypothetical protein
VVEADHVAGSHAGSLAWPSLSSRRMTIADLTAPGRRTSMLAGQPATSISFNAPTTVASLLPSDLDSATPANGSFNWKTRIGSFKFSGCA